MNILIDDMNDWLTKSPNRLEIIESVIKTSIEEEGFSLEVEVSVTLTDNNEIKQINAEHRGIDRVTDVISFPQIDWTSIELESNDYGNLPGEDIILGDIVISVDRLIEQAAEYNHSLERELGFLVAHSMFHLLGYDHVSEEEEQEMIHKQEKVLGKLGLVR
ncbi:MAG TPA: rRNA maturation RNase YbeY [Epulopiscium sp.]|nr:rRNA maturation RNase YbeY [Candidatus Epulonipiscium sp.]